MGTDRALFDNQGKLVQSLRVDFNKRQWFWLSTTQFSSEVKNAILMIEDKRFYSHHGVDLIAIFRALKSNIASTSSRRQGASTITMQLTDLIDRNVFLKNKFIRKGSWPHKISQVLEALVLETKWSKEQILEAYLNLIHLRGELQGVPALSFGYFEKSPESLGLTESLLIASMISSPNISPEKLAIKTCRNFRNAYLQKTATSIEDMCADIHLKALLFSSSAKKWNSSEGNLSHFLRRLMTSNPMQVSFSSFIDMELQNHVVEVLEKNVKRLSEMNVQDMSALVIENKTGNILAYVGAVSTSKSPHVDGVTSYRQAGSSLKPFFYSLALDKKLLTSASVLMDDSTALTWGNDIYRPINYDKHFYGPISLREALSSSLNVPAVKTVMNVGLRNSYNLLTELKFSNLKQPDFYGVSMALGAVEVRLDELANAYRSLANDGTWSELKLFINDVNTTQPKIRIFSPQTSFIVSSILSDPYSRSIGFGMESPLETPFWTAVKTGTSREYHDNWCVGFSQHYTVAVWAGNFDSTPMLKVSGVSGAGPSWFDIMSFLHQKKKSLKPMPPDGVIEKKIRHEWQSHEKTEYFIKGTEPIQNLISVESYKKPQFVFPAERSVIVFDPHQSEDKIALYVRYKGFVPEGTQIWLNNKNLGEAISPFKIEKVENGENEIKLVFKNQILTSVKFRKRQN